MKIFIYASLFILPFLTLRALDKTAEQNEQNNVYFLCVGDGLPADECRAGVFGE